MFKSLEASSTLKAVGPPQCLSHPCWHYLLGASLGLYSNLGCDLVYHFLDFPLGAATATSLYQSLQSLHWVLL